MMAVVSPVLIAYLVSAAAYAGFQWTVHVVIYRQFSAVPVEAFAEYERLHQRRISYMVGPLFAALVVSVGWLLIDSPATVARWAALLAAALVAVIVGITAFAAVPLHRRLSGEWDGKAYRQLLRVDLLRTLVATASLVLAVAITIN